MAKSNERIKARILRGEGKSIKEVAKLVGASTSTVSGWCKDIRLTPEQISELERHARDPRYGRRLENSLKQHEEVVKRREAQKTKGIKEMGKLNKREFFLAGVALYWAEGFKKDSQAGLANLDPDMIRFFIKWLQDCFDYKIEDLSVRITINISHRYRIDKVREYWSGITGIAIESFQKPFYQKSIWKKQYDNPENYYGILRVKVRKSTYFLSRLEGYIESLKLYTKVR